MRAVLRLPPRNRTVQHLATRRASTVRACVRHAAPFANGGWPSATTPRRDVSPVPPRVSTGRPRLSTGCLAPCDGALVRSSGATCAALHARSVSTRTAARDVAAAPGQWPAREALPRVLVLGPAGSGKGTQCQRLARRFGSPHISTGELLRAEVAAGSAQGRAAEAVMQSGGLVPDSLVRQVLAARLAADDCWSHGWIGDGWVREEVNAASLLRLDAPALVVELDVPRHVCEARIGGRRERDAGEPSGDGDGDGDGSRADDAASVVRARLDSYEANRTACLDAFRRAGVRVARVDGQADPDAVFASLEALWLEAFGGAHGGEGGDDAAASGPAVVADVGGVRVIDAEAWWATANGQPVGARLRRLLHTAGVEFWDGNDTGADGTTDHAFVKAPSVALSAVGGLPLRLPDGGKGNGTVELALGSRGTGPRVTPSQLAGALATQMGLASFPSYLNPNDATAQRMYDIVAKHGHFSVGHAASVSFVVAGHSCAVENELNSQRDVIHLARLTVARTAVQTDPPIVVPHGELLPLYRAVRSATRDALGAAPRRPDDVGALDWHEARNSVWPASKAQLVMITGSLRNLQKLVGDVDGDGKEVEYRTILWHMNRVLHALLPTMFRPCHEFAFRPPHTHAAADAP